MNGGSLFTPKKNIYTVKYGTKRARAPSESPSPAQMGLPAVYIPSPGAPLPRRPPQCISQASCSDSGPCSQGPACTAVREDTRPTVRDSHVPPSQPFLWPHKKAQAALPGELPRPPGPSAVLTCLGYQRLLLRPGRQNQRWGTTRAWPARLCSDPDLWAQFARVSAQNTVRWRSPSRVTRPSARTPCPACGRPGPAAPFQQKERLTDSPPRPGSGLVPSRV